MWPPRPQSFARAGKLKSFEKPKGLKSREIAALRHKHQEPVRMLDSP
jgi:hypothetical protein